MAVNVLRLGLIPFAFPGLPNIRCVFTTKDAGNISLHQANLGKEDKEATNAARRALLGAFGKDSWTELKQVHGDDFLINPDPMSLDREPLVAADGQATDRKGHVLCIKTADCQPILLAHPKGYVAGIHAGWRGNALGFPTSAVAKFCDAFSLDPADVRAVRGPSLGYAEFVNFEREWPASFARWHDPVTRLVDLWAITRHQLCEAGLKPGNIHGLDLCTYSLNTLFFSHRRGDSGRQAGLVWMEDV